MTELMRRRRALLAASDPDPEQPDVKNGLYHENGRIVYYENGVLVRSRLVYADGYYYYIANYGAAIVNATHYVNATAANGLKPAGTYTFDAEGHMVIDGTQAQPGWTGDRS